MKFLILSVTAGQGHFQCAQAVQTALTAKGHDCRVLDSYKHIVPALGETIDKGYLLSTKYLPEIYGRIYDFANDKGFGAELTHRTQKLVYKRLIDKVNDYAPDAIICTHVFPAICLTIAEAKHRFTHIPTVGIITDFTIHPYWEQTDLDAYVVPDSLLGYQCARKGFPPEKVFPLGIPVAEKFSEKIPKNDARRLLSIEDRDTILVMTGSMGFGDVPELISAIDRLEQDFQILCVCGNNRKNLEEISSGSYRHKVFPFGFVHNVDVMMDAADFIITKPGGLSVSESLAKNLPMILVDPIPGQESRNREFLLNAGLALAVSRTCPVEEAVYQLYQSRHRFENNLLTSPHRHPNAASDVADLAVSLTTRRSL